MKYQYIVIRTDGAPYTICSDNNLFDNGWHKMAKDYRLNWLFAQMWENGKHQSTIYNHQTGVKLHFR